MRWIAGTIFPVTDADNDCVSLVALDTLQVLNKEPLRDVLVKESLQLRMFLNLLVKRSLDAVHVLNPHGDDTQRFMRVLSRMTNNKLSNLPNLARRALFLTINVAFLFGCAGPALL